MRIAIEQSFFYLKDKLGNIEECNIRKRFCMAYLKWKTYGKRTMRDEWVLLGVEYRKEYSEVGGKRTILERKSRRYLKDTMLRVKKLAPSRKGASEFSRKQAKEGTGYDSPEARRKSKQALLNYMEKCRKEGKDPSAKEWVITQRDGLEFRVYNLSKWCRDNKVHRRHLLETAIGLSEYSKNRKVRKYDPELDSHIPWEHELEGRLSEPPPP